MDVQSTAQQQTRYDPLPVDIRLQRLYSNIRGDIVMPLTDHHTWHVRIHKIRASSIMAAIHSFRDSGFVVTELPVGPSWSYSLKHSNKHAMTLHMLRSDANNFTVTAEWHNA
jgi:hypothetical protein